MMQTEIDRMRRQTALRFAVDNAGQNMEADQIVRDAEEFRVFLAGEPTPTTEGTE